MNAEKPMSKSGKIVFPTSFSKFATKHFVALQSLRESFFACHAGLLHLEEKEFKSFNAGLPAFSGTLEKSPGFENIRYQAQVAGFSMVIKDLLQHIAKFLEETRRFLEFQKISTLPGTLEEKNAALREAVKSSPKTLSALADSLAGSLPGGFQQAAELKSLVSLQRLLMLSLRQPVDASKQKQVAKLLFLIPQKIVRDDKNGSVAFRVKRVQRELPLGSRIPIDAELIQQVFFTAYAVSLSVAKVVQTNKRA
jgi:hypothetical protein